MKPCWAGASWASAAASLRPVPAAALPAPISCAVLTLKRAPHHRQVLEGDTFYEFLVDEASGRWQHWRERIPRWEYPAGVERPRFAQLVIPTLDSVRYEHLLGLVHGVGKVALVR